MEDPPPTNLTDQVKVAVEKIMGGSVKELREEYRQNQLNLACEHDSDSDSEDDITDKIRYLAEEDTTWFEGCGFKFTLDTSVFVTQILISSVIIAFCILKLWSTDDCSVMSTYAPLLSAVVMYLLSNIKITKKRK